MPNGEVVDDTEPRRRQAPRPGYADGVIYKIGIKSRDELTRGAVQRSADRQQGGADTG